jgi:hypothetical protein
MVCTFPIFIFFIGNRSRGVLQKETIRKHMGFTESFDDVESQNIERYERSNFGGLPGVHRFPCTKETVDAFAEVYRIDYDTLG